MMDAVKQARPVCNQRKTVTYLSVLISLLGFYCWQLSLTSFLVDKEDATSPRQRKSPTIGYKPSSTEQYIIENSKQFGFDLVYNRSRDMATVPPSCRIWADGSSLLPSNASLTTYFAALDDYNHKISTFTPIDDLRDRLAKDGNYDICESVDLHKDGVAGIFSNGLLSFGGSFGSIEPLLPPMRHPKFCFNRTYLMELDYLIHDFGTFCRKLKPTSKTVFVDMGASFVFGQKRKPSGVFSLIELYRKFGIVFDHIYGYEVTLMGASDVYHALPAHLRSAYHWINAGVDADVDSPMNPFNILKDHFTVDDFVVVKLDIDTPAIEGKLAQQLLQDDQLASLIDVFYFEHHVFLPELMPYWGSGVAGSILDSLELFSTLRKRGIGAHFWV